MDVRQMRMLIVHLSVGFCKSLVVLRRKRQTVIEQRLLLVADGRGHEVRLGGLMVRGVVPVVGACG